MSQGCLQIFEKICIHKQINKCFFMHFYGDVNYCFLLLRKLKHSKLFGMKQVIQNQKQLKCGKIFQIRYICMWRFSKLQDTSTFCTVLLFFFVTSSCRTVECKTCSRCHKGMKDENSLARFAFVLLWIESRLLMPTFFILKQLILLLNT